MDESDYPIHSLFVDIHGDIFLNKNKTNKYPPQENTEYWKNYAFSIIDKDINFFFDDTNLLKKTYYLKLFPGVWKSESVFVIEKVNNLPNVSVSIEFLKRIHFMVNIPFKIKWNSKNFIPDLTIKTKIAREFNLNSVKFLPNGKIKIKKPDAENYIGVIKLKKLPNQGTVEGSIEYSYKPEGSISHSNWGEIRDQNTRMVQKYTQELPFWRGSKELQNIIQRISKFDSILIQCLHVFNFVRQFVKAENLEIRKGINNLLSEKEPTGDCDEFTDLIVAILRKLKIPVRRVTGISYPDTFHAWPEVYSSNLNVWFPLDAAQNTFGYLKTSIIPLTIEGTSSHQDTIKVLTSQTHYLTEINSEVDNPKVEIVPIRI